MSENMTEEERAFDIAEKEEAVFEAARKKLAEQPSKTIGARCMHDLKPCPCCGGEAVVHHCLGECWIDCDGCGMSSEMFSTLAGASAAWNRRANSWISVKDRMPNSTFRNVLAWIDGKVEIVLFEGPNWYCMRLSEDVEVTYWQPLPEGPSV